MTARVTVLSGGVGGAKLALGLYGVLPPEALTVIANTGDDFDRYTLRVCPDSDIVTYTLAGVVETQQGWGIAGDTFHALRRVRQLGGSAWFNLGDSDLGVHLHRTQRLHEGVPLHRIAAEIAAALGVRCAIVPMSDERVTTVVKTDAGALHLQEYLVRERTEPRVRGIRFDGAEAAQPAPGVQEALSGSDLVLLAPSNPLISIAPILAVPGLRRMVQQAPGRRVAVSPVVGGRSLKGPTDRMLSDLGHEVSPVTIARMYHDVVDTLVIDEQDAALAPRIEAEGVQCAVLPTVMDTDTAKQALARALLKLAEG